MKGTKIFVIVLILLIIIVGALFALRIFGQNNETQMANANGEITNEVNISKEPTIA